MRRPITAKSTTQSWAHIMLMSVLAVMWALPVCWCPHCFGAAVGLTMVSPAEATVSESTCCGASKDGSAGESTLMPVRGHGDEGDCDCQWEVDARSEAFTLALVSPGVVEPYAYPPMVLTYASVEVEADDRGRGRVGGHDLVERHGPPGSPSLVHAHVQLLI